MPNDNWTIEHITKCRVCGSGRLDTVFEMGHMPLANALRVSRSQGHVRFPLTLLFCEECSLVQIRETVDKSVLFSKDYIYYSSQSKTMVESARELVDDICRSRTFLPDDLVMEAASNDGYLLQHYVRSGVRVLGVDPAAECARVAETVGVETEVQFFTAKFAKTYAGEVSVFHANNVLAHVENQNDFVRGVATVLKDDGLAVIEVPYLGDMIVNREFDTVYHEHLCYFSLTALNKLFQQHGLTITDVDVLPIHGGSIRVWVHKWRSTSTSAVRYLLAQEQKRGMHTWKYYADFGARANMLGSDLWRCFDKIHRETEGGGSFAGYGAAAKGNQLLSYFNIDFLDHVIDSTPAKQGKFMAGVDTPIVAPYEFRRYDDPGYVLILAWNFKDEIMAKHPEFKGKWIIPIPEVKLV